MSVSTWTRSVCPVLFLLLTACLVACKTKSESATADDSAFPVYGPYRVISLPVTRGVRILNPIQLATGPGGQVFAANQSGEVYTLLDSDNDGLEDEARLYCNVTDFGLHSPAGFAYRGDTVYIGTSEEIRIFLDRDKDLRADTSWTFFNNIPYSQHPYEWTCGFSFGPDGWLYFNLTTDSWNAGASPDSNKYRGAILRISPDGKKLEKLAVGIRSVYGMTFNKYGDLFFTDNEGGGNPHEELNRLVTGAFYGHNPKKYAGYDSATGPALVLQTEAAPAAIAFNPADNDFGGTGGDLFIAFYGPGERWQRGAVGRVKMERSDDGSYRYSEFPIADIPKLSALTFGKNGALYLASHGVSDYWYNSVKDTSGRFYKIVYDPALKSVAKRTRSVNHKASSPGAIEEGKQLFAEAACLACHAVDDNAELLGPNLRGIGKRLSREEILDDIKNPSKIIKPSMAGLKVTKKNGQVLLGRAVNSNDREISLMLIGNSIVNIPRSEIARTENETKSLMYENLIHGMSQQDINNLLDYIVSLE